MKKVIFFLIICTSFLSAQTSIFRSKQLFLYKDYLTETKDYYRAITETYRYYFNKGNNTNRLNFELGRLYYLGQNYNLSRNFLYRFLDGQSHLTDETKDARKMLFFSYYYEEDWRNALLELQDLNIINMKPNEQTEYYLKSAELYIKIFDTKRAEEALSHIADKHNSNLKLLLSKKQESEHLPYKNRTLSVILAAVPGMNLLYCGKYKQGLIAFLTQTAASGLSYYSFKRGDWVSGFIIGSTTLSWYFYNFKRAGLVADQYNENIKNQFQTSFSIPFD